ncbi:hypothetical protein EQ831_19865 [Pseudomonas sp. ALS1279]|nr:hypothetical protein EQ831_19865 [Pseudomonas sp. ALS1279]
MNGGAFFNAEFGIRHRGSTVPERSGVALSFCRRQVIKKPHQLPGAAFEKTSRNYLRLAFSSMRRARSLASSAVC